MANLVVPDAKTSKQKTNVFKLKSTRRVARRGLRLAQRPPHRLDDPHIELASRFTRELLEGFRGRTLGPVALRPVGPAPKHNVVGVWLATRGKQDTRMAEQVRKIRHQAIPECIRGLCYNSGIYF